MPRPHAGADADDLRVLILIGYDLVEQRQDSAVPAIHDRQAADLDDVELRQDGADRRLGAGNHLLVDERFAHQPRNHVLRIGAIRFHVGAAANAALGSALNIIVPTSWPASAALNCPDLSPLTNWISRMCRAVSMRSSWSCASSSCTLMRGMCRAVGSFFGSAV